MAVPPTPLGRVFGVPMTLRLALFALAFVPQGCAMSGMTMAQTNYLLDIAPNRRRATYVAFSSLLGFPLAWWPVAGAFIIGEARFALGFGIALLAAIGTVTLVTRLREPRAADLAASDNIEHDPPKEQATAAGG